MSALGIIYALASLKRLTRDVIAKVAHMDFVRRSWCSDLRLGNLAMKQTN